MLRSPLEYEQYFHFHHEEHRTLTASLIKNVSSKLSFQLKVQKASIQFIGKAPFAVIGYRRSKKSIFIEFYTAEELAHKRIIQTIDTKVGLPLHRVEINTLNDIDDGLINWICNSCELVS